MRIPVSYVIDANVLLRFADPNSPQHGAVRRSVLSVGSINLFLAPQAMYEAWVVMTRPSSLNGFGWLPSKAHAILAGVRSQFLFVPDPLNLVDEWLALCLQHNVSGNPAHDARLAAYAIAVGADGVLTLNPGDFRRFGITVLVP
ncbi:hypothetical protein BH11ARM2_BH11ARM2_38910 [soil metagenome]